MENQKLSGVLSVDISSAGQRAFIRESVVVLVVPVVLVVASSSWWW